MPPVTIPDRVEILPASHPTPLEYLAAVLRPPDQHIPGFESQRCPGSEALQDDVGDFDSSVFAVFHVAHSVLCVRQFFLSSSCRYSKITSDSFSNKSTGIFVAV
jgi:hypothetical protein